MKKKLDKPIDEIEVNDEMVVAAAADINNVLTLNPPFDLKKPGEELQKDVEELFPNLVSSDALSEETWITLKALGWNEVETPKKEAEALKVEKQTPPKPAPKAEKPAPKSNSKSVLKLAEIIIDAGTQTRVKLNEDTIADYAEAMTEGGKFPPIVVFASGTEYLLADGFHRFMAAQRNGWRDMEVEIRKGSRLDAIKYSLGANTIHGLRRTNADKRQCVEIALKEFGKQSDRAIAEMCGISHEFVRQERANSQVSTVDTCQKHTQTLTNKALLEPETPRIGRDGKSYPAVKQAEKKIEKDTKPPREGLKFAKLAIENLKQIAKDDKERVKAFTLVQKWLDKNGK